MHSLTLIVPSSTVQNSTGPATAGRGFVLIALGFALAWFAVSPTARAVDPPPDGGYPNDNTAEGLDALLLLTTGSDNTAIGAGALLRNTTGNNNTATGSAALLYNSSGPYNTATGVSALYTNTTGATTRQPASKHLPLRRALLPLTTRPPVRSRCTPPRAASTTRPQV
jgi:hypothetical protein